MSSSTHSVPALCSYIDVIVQMVKCQVTLQLQLLNHSEVSTGPEHQTEARNCRSFRYHFFFLVRYVCQLGTCDVLKGDSFRL